ncbi:uncharacterized protein B0H64DRAFT_34801 [Chaetomium fimeti]|uniref:Uncharacterized protein n=1 Tax=Chaetomium fimeti TaxID=1854472 RepID=A0AAE0HRB8_9PEZI|nr:hypothetical protein B0H64DRAFT_34801 [Chaetomium fimeti]
MFDSAVAHGPDYTRGRPFACLVQVQPIYSFPFIEHAGPNRILLPNIRTSSVSSFGFKLFLISAPSSLSPRLVIGPFLSETWLPSSYQGPRIKNNVVVGILLCNGSESTAQTCSARNYATVPVRPPRGSSPACKTTVRRSNLPSAAVGSCVRNSACISVVVEPQDWARRHAIAPVQPATSPRTACLLKPQPIVQEAGHISDADHILEGDAAS